VITGGATDGGFSHDPQSGGARPADGGFSLIEVLVTTALMSVIGAAMTVAMVQTYRSTARQESVMSIAFQTHLAFQRLDSEIRYAYAMMPPAANPSTAGFHYAEYSVQTAGVTQCVQLRLGGQRDVLQRRTQRAGESIGSWSTLATGVGSDARFILTKASADGNQHDRLTITMKVRSDTGEIRRPVQFAFTALNTGVGTSSNVCSALDRA
jgi:prepilin-type N-terminal cleavage/methylation domain-containing protein